MNFGIRLKELRTKKKLTQLQMAEILDTSKSNISKYEAGSVEPNLETLVKISRYFDVPVDYLLKNEIATVDYAAYKVDTSEFGYEFKCKLRDILQEKDISTKQFSEMTGFHPEDVDLYLLGNKIPSLEELVKIAGALNVSTDYLLGRSNNSTSIFCSEIASRIKNMAVISNKNLDDLLPLLKTKILDGECYNIDNFMQDIYTISDFFGTTDEYILGGKELENKIDYSLNDEEKKFLFTFQHLNQDNKDIILGDMKKYIKEQRQASVAADEPLKKTGTTNSAK